MNLVKAIDIVAGAIAKGAGDPLSDDQHQCLAGSLGVLLTQPRMNKAEFGALLSIVAYPTSRSQERKQEAVPILIPWLSNEATRHGYKDWQDAYRKLREGK